jgi:hypothetical protein
MKKIRNVGEVALEQTKTIETYRAIIKVICNFIDGDACTDIEAELRKHNVPEEQIQILEKEFKAIAAARKERENSLCLK